MKKFVLLVIPLLVILIVSLSILLGCSVEQSTKTTEPSTSIQMTSTIKEVRWNLSGAIMPENEYGSRDISGSDRASVLIVKQTKTQVQITGMMDGLRKNTSYTVLLSKGYIPKTQYPGLFTDRIPAFTFINSAEGVYRWTFIILDADFPGPGTYTLSLWISETAPDKAVLISDNFDIIIK